MGICIIQALGLCYPVLKVFSQGVLENFSLMVCVSSAMVKIRGSLLGLLIPKINSV